ncbi:helix-turn-helix transcriptional regulator [Tateyamaria sp. Alg231-49]|uniref:helix-turn-helix transcriptional regulator n=1 Tax=Tateyamaria sp. Alg231-49 TaxID=1922219 RepID=UPI0034D19635
MLMTQNQSLRLEDDLLTPAAAASLVGVSVSTFKRMRLRGDGPQALQVTSRTFRYRRAEVEAWLERQAVPVAVNHVNCHD